MATACTGFPLLVFAVTMNRVVSRKSSPSIRKFPRSSATAVPNTFSLLRATAVTLACGASFPIIPVTCPAMNCPCSQNRSGLNAAVSAIFAKSNLLHPRVRMSRSL